MFTGIVTDVGRVRALEKRSDARFVIGTAYDSSGIDIGASIACSGCCLTVVEKGRDAEGDWFAVDVSAESLDCTTLGTWTEGTRINLERALKAGDELGGHIVSGHVDGVARIVDIKPDGASQRFVFEAPEELGRFIAPKGSVTLDGTSLTVNEVEDVAPAGAKERRTRFDINIIPHTQAVTTWGMAKAGDPVNLEIDMLARYVARLVQKD
ncbi:riboflavin synthase [Parvibaculum sp.]|uniref:riboflavin synthase n=1 Tax=Parvibaculum sp. TaxID=2024848 RepID=UPI001D65D4CE|nr:riboflavin synthase [Parvibaculum sp.]MBX3488089.1 riboflavin synthase [Parvibaculum sp.]MCW5727933.1 riboflavin synthase [Parvibaculum sp.]